MCVCDSQQVVGSNTVSVSLCVCQDSQQVVEVFKTGFEPPGDVEFEDHSAPMRRSISESSYLDNRAEQRHTRRNSRGRLWPFIRKNKVEAGGRHVVMDGSWTDHGLRWLSLLLTCPLSLSVLS